MPSIDCSQPSIRALAFLLPQFHPVPENDEWWGKGFTEWRNVTNARPLFPGHYQPHLPADLGFYDLRLPEVREAQAALAREYGIGGFVYYHYWFNGRRILERPFDEVLASGKPDFPFCLCWANENWTRVWDGGEKHVLLEQRHSQDDDLAHIKSLIPAFRDPRYIRVDGKPVFLIYRTELLPDPAATARIWRRAAMDAGLDGLYLVRVESFSRGIDPKDLEFDAAVEFAPDGYDQGEWMYRFGFSGFLSRIGVLPRAFSQHRVVSYPALARGKSRRPAPPYKQFRCVSPMWDNSARRKVEARILVDSTPELYEEWLYAMARQTRQRHRGDERILFINAWNEWAEGCHLEPDLKWGRRYLEATRRALARAAEPEVSSAASPAPSQSPAKHVPQHGMALRNLYWKLRAWLGAQAAMWRLVFQRQR